MDYNLYRTRLFTSLLSKCNHVDFIGLINDLHGQGIKKNEIYDLFLEFFKDIQVDSRTKDDDMLYDELTEFMDGFSNKKGFRILPDEIIRE